MKPCINCESENIKLTEDGNDWTTECLNCGEIIENGVLIREAINRISEFDIWLYPRDLQDRPMILNLFRMEENEPIQINEYKLPENWKELCIPNTDVSIHDIMEAV